MPLIRYAAPCGLNTILISMVSTERPTYMKNGQMMELNKFQARGENAMVAPRVAVKISW